MFEPLGFKRIHELPAVAAHALLTSDVALMRISSASWQGGRLSLLPTT